MHILIALAGVAVAAYYFINRTRNVANAATDVFDMANDVRLAARRFGFKRRTNQHPVDGIDDPRLAIGALAVAFLDLDDYPTQDQRDRLLVALQSQFDLSMDDATEMMVLGRWFMAECGGPAPTVARLSRKAYKLQGAEAITPLLTLVQASAAPTGLSDKQRDALEDVKRAFRLS